MKKREKRENERFSEVGRVNSPMISSLSGVLDDISISGCRVHFPNPVTLNLENEYVLILTIVKMDAVSELKMVCQPQWVKENPEESQTEIGFSFLRSPDSPELTKFIENLQNNLEKSDITNLINEDDVSFIC